MLGYYYFHLAPKNAVALSALPGHIVWLYLDGKPDPVRWSDPQQPMPAGANAAVVALRFEVATVGAPLGVRSFKDPIPDPPPPPPPPAHPADLDSYLKQPGTTAFFGELPRGFDP